MRHLFVVDSLDKQMQNEKELIHLASAGGMGYFVFVWRDLTLIVLAAGNDFTRMIINWKHYSKRNQQNPTQNSKNFLLEPSI